MGDFFKNTVVLIIFIAIFAFVGLCLSGCTGTVSYYDENGRLTRVEEVTNFSRIMDGTNQKSQMLLMDGTYLGFEVSAAAGENCTPGVVTRFARGKSAVINARDKAGFLNVSGVVEKFFAGEIKADPSGITARQP